MSSRKGRRILSRGGHTTQRQGNRRGKTDAARGPLLMTKEQNRGIETNLWIYQSMVHALSCIYPWGLSSESGHRSWARIEKLSGTWTNGCSREWQCTAKITLQAFRQAAPGRWCLPVRRVLRRLHPRSDVSLRGRDTVGFGGMKIQIPISLGLVFLSGREGEL